MPEPSRQLPSLEAPRRSQISVHFAPTFLELGSLHKRKGWNCMGERAANTYTMLKGKIDQPERLKTKRDVEGRKQTMMIDRQGIDSGNVKLIERMPEHRMRCLYTLNAKRGEGRSEVVTR